MPTYSVIVPVFNRPEEIDELLISLTKQSLIDFEVIIVEDGSTIDCKKIAELHLSNLDIKYFYKDNSGQGYSRNFGSKHATGKWLVFFDSDCVIPKDYFAHLDELTNEKDTDAYCGPDTASPDFSVLQKAISYSMTSVFTTGGIRGDKNSVDKISQLRSYNMVVRKTVFDSLGGFGKTNMGEDMEFSHRFHNENHDAIIAQDIFVYHKRRNSIRSFYNQIFSFGRTRVLLKRDFGIPIKLVHYFPICFTFSFLICFVGSLIGNRLLEVGMGIFGFYFFLIFFDSSVKWGRLSVGFVAAITSFVQLTAYGLGMMKELLIKT